MSTLLRIRIPAGAGRSTAVTDDGSSGGSGGSVGGRRRGSSGSGGRGGKLLKLREIEPCVVTVVDVCGGVICRGGVGLGCEIAEADFLAADLF